jgi:hypothetical protein
MKISKPEHFIELFRNEAYELASIFITSRKTLQKGG